MTHTKRCRGSFRMVVGVTCGDGTKLFRETSECATCGTWLPLGPSDERPVAVEVRAAELADSYQHHETLDTYAASEWYGWLCASNGVEVGEFHDEHHAGYLARVIYDHDREEHGL